MNKHIVAITQYEWISWGDKLTLRLMPNRIVWASDAQSSRALISSLEAAPDLRPEDDGFLIAVFDEPPLPSQNSAAVDVMFEGVSFHALADRGAELLDSLAKRLNSSINAPPSADIANAWVEWKLIQRRRESIGRVKIFWEWTFQQKLINDEMPVAMSDAIHTIELLERDSPSERTRNAKNSFYVGTNAFALHSMITAGIDVGLISKSPGKGSEGTVRSFLDSQSNKRKSSTRFFDEDNNVIQSVVGELKDRISSGNLGILLAFLIATHHSHRISEGQDFLIEDFMADLNRVICEDWISDAEVNPTLSLACTALARALPVESIKAIRDFESTHRNWINNIHALREQVSQSSADAKVEALPVIETPEAPVVVTTSTQGSEGGDSEISKDATFPVEDQSYLADTVVVSEEGIQQGTQIEAVSAKDVKTQIDVEPAQTEGAVVRDPNVAHDIADKASAPVSSDRSDHMSPSLNESVPEKLGEEFEMIPVGVTTKKAAKATKRARKTAAKTAGETPKVKPPRKSRKVDTNAPSFDFETPVDSQAEDKSSAE